MSNKVKILITILVIVAVGILGIVFYVNNYAKSSADMLQNGLSFFSNHHYINDPGNGSGHSHSSHHVASASIYGVVTSKSNNKPLPNIEIVIRPNITASETAYTAKSGIDGAYSLSLPAGDYNITANPNLSPTYDKAYATFILKSVVASYLPVSQNIQLAPAAINLIKNGDFEAGDTLWSKYVSLVLLQTRGNVFIGSSAHCYLAPGKCLVMTKNSSSSLNASQVINGLEANKTYQFNAKFKTVWTTQPSSAYVSIYDATAKKYAGQVKVAATKDQWKDITLKFTTTSENVNHRWLVYLVGNYVPNSYIIYDNASLTKTN